MPRPPAVQLPALDGTTSHRELFVVVVVSIQTSSFAFVFSILYVSCAAYWIPPKRLEKYFSAKR